MDRAFFDPLMNNYARLREKRSVKIPVLLLATMLLCAAADSQEKSATLVNDANRDTKPSVPRDGQHDFDFEIGRWRTHLRRLLRPLSGSSTWVEYTGTSVVSKVWDGRANLLELEVDGAAGHIEGLSLRLYNPEARQWSLNFSNSKLGTLSTPTIGEFKNSRGEFYGQDTLSDGRTILVRFVITCSSPDKCHFEQSFSDDGGKNWELNWVADDERF
jgi:hypothetical protein